MDVYGAVIHQVLTRSRLPTAILVLCIGMLCCGCDRHVVVTREMTWQCVPEERDLGYPEAEPVMFRYTEDPEHYVLASGRGLCQQLQASGKSTARITFDVWVTPFGRLHGYNIESINGLPRQDVGGPGRSGVHHHGTDNPGPDPLESAFQ
jgi:hypothetical protein